MTPFGRGHAVIAGCRPRVRGTQVPVRQRHRALPALSAAGANQPRGRHRATIPLLLAGQASPLAGAAAAGVVLASLQRFLLEYSGVFALVALTAAVAAGLAAADRLVVSPAGRVTVQAVHRALSLAAVGFLASHVLLEVLAHRSHAIDTLVPFLASGRTLYLGLGTLASDLILLITLTGVARGRFASHWTATWRGVHVTAYLAWPLAILHGLLSGRTAKPYVDWSYGACVAAVAVALVVRLMAPRRGSAAVVPAPGPGPAVPGLPAYLSAPPQPGAFLPAPPPAYPALPAGSHDDSTQYGVVYGIVDDGVPRAPETP